ncbi:MAG: hypothetical protein V4773_02435 [Verrucomicrobiota bacterium]
MPAAASTLDHRPGASAPSAVPLIPPVAPARARNPLTRAVLFLALLTALIGGVHASIHFGLRRISTSSFGITNRIVAGQINADIVVTGSSRAMVHYDPRVLSAATGLSVFNLGRNGSQTDLQLAVLKTYLAHNTAPRLVIHNLDLYAFATSHEIYDPAQYLPYLSEPTLYSAVRRVYPDAWKWKYLPLYGYIVPDTRFTWLLGLKRTFGFEPREDNIDGFVPRPWAWTNDFDAFRRANPQGTRTAFEPQGLRDLEDLLHICRDRGIRVLLVYSPEYFEIQPLQLNRAHIFTRFQALSRRFEAPLWDYSDTMLSRTRAYFYNSQHLNADGAAAFSQALAQRLAAPESAATLLAPRS